MSRKRTPAIDTVLNAIDAHMGDCLRRQRVLMGMSQEKLAEHAGVSFQQIQKYEHGMSSVSAGGLFLFAHILTVPVGWFYEDLSPALLDGVHQVPRPGEDGDILYRRETLDLIRTYYRIEDREQRHSFCNLLKSMAGKTESAATAQRQANTAMITPGRDTQP